MTHERIVILEFVCLGCGFVYGLIAASLVIQFWACIKDSIAIWRQQKGPGA